MYIFFLYICRISYCCHPGVGIGVFIGYFGLSFLKTHISLNPEGILLILYCGLILVQNFTEYHPGLVRCLNVTVMDYENCFFSDWMFLLKILKTHISLIHG